MRATVKVRSFEDLKHKDISLNIPSPFCLLFLMKQNSCIVEKNANMSYRKEWNTLCMMYDVLIWAG